MSEYEIYVGKKLVMTANNLVEVYRSIQWVYQMGLYTPQPIMSRLRAWDRVTEFFVSYILFEVDRNLYIRPIKVKRPCLTSQLKLESAASVGNINPQANLYLAL